MLFRSPKSDIYSAATKYTHISKLQRFKTDMDSAAAKCTHLTKLQRFKTDMDSAAAKCTHLLNLQRFKNKGQLLCCPKILFSCFVVLPNHSGLNLRFIQRPLSARIYLTYSGLNTFKLKVYSLRPQHFLYLRPLPQGQGSFLPTFLPF